MKRVKNLCPTELRILLRYEPTTGKLFYRKRPIWYFEDTPSMSTKENWVRWNSRYCGKELFTSGSNGYLKATILGSQYLAHRVAWAIYTGAWPIKCIDHMDGNGENNNFSNLREATLQENQRNTRSRENSSSKYLGVSWSKVPQKWLASIQDTGKSFHIGLFDKEEDAAKAYDERAKLIFGDFANTNF